MRIVGKTRGQPIGACIYCGDTTEPLSAEHVVPLSLGGNLILPKASCYSCADATKRFEQTCARAFFGPLRLRFNLPTRNRRERPAELALRVQHASDNWREIRIPAHKHPMVFVGARLTPPGIVFGRPPTNLFADAELVFKAWNNEVKELGVVPGERLEWQGGQWGAFCKLLAKIAHGYTVSQIGLPGFSHFLPDLILGRSDLFPYYIGGDWEEPMKPPGTRLIELQLHKLNNTDYLFVAIRLFCFLDAPQYIVVVGKDMR
jgi:hypothetical protein